MTVENEEIDPSIAATGGSSTLIDQHHPLFLQPCDTPGSSLISVKLTRPENYIMWSSVIHVTLLEKSKLGFVDGRYPKEKFNVSLHELWEKYNAIILSWIMNLVSAELLCGMVYATSAHKIWMDLKERFDKMNGSRVLYLHKQIATLTKGISYVPTYFSKLKEFCTKFDARMPCPGCGCDKSKKYVEHFQYQRLLQFLVGLHESHSQSSNQILNMLHVPSINKVYAMIISEKSISGKGYNNATKNHTHTGGLSNNYPSGHSYTGGSNYRSKKNTIYCDYCNFKGHTRETCYKLNGYPLDFKTKKKAGSGNTTHFTQETTGATRTIKISQLILQELSGGQVKGIDRKDDSLYIFYSAGVNITDIQAQNVYSASAKVFQSDNGSKFLNSQNGVAKRRHQYILEMARSLRFQASVPLKFWGECVTTTVYIINRLPSTVLQGKSPFEALNGHVPSLDHMRVFACLGYVIDVRKSDKFALRAIPAVFLGYSMTSKGLQNV
ncbi:uncharacterized protein [Nicotiana sylvestris]|uniref:uncharacterized protein n=1 Tax=Nicotiana sylvestris TaxID=4096 RepID=UPI00388CA576